MNMDDEVNMDDEELPNEVKEFINYKHNYERDEEECLHQKCPECNGTGTKSDGMVCIHMISCGCRKCSPRM